MQGFVLTETTPGVVKQVNVLGARKPVFQFRVPQGNRLILRTDEPFFVAFAVRTTYSITSGDVTNGYATITLSANLAKPSVQGHIARGLLLRAFLDDGAATEEYDNPVREGSGFAAGYTQVDFANNQVTVDFGDTTAAEAAGNNIHVYSRLGDGRFYFAKIAPGRNIDEFSDAFAGPYSCRSFLEMDFRKRDEQERFQREFVIDENNTLAIYLEADVQIVWEDVVYGADLNPPGVYKVIIPCLLEPKPTQVAVPEAVPTPTPTPTLVPAQ